MSMHQVPTDDGQRLPVSHAPIEFTPIDFTPIEFTPAVAGVGL